jgi:hypothetical protein
VNNANNTQVETSKRREGGVDIHEIIVSTIASAMANGALDGPIRSRTGTSLQPRGR